MPRIVSIRAKISRALQSIVAARARSGRSGVAAALLVLVRRAAVLPLLVFVDVMTDLHLGVRTRGALHREAAVNGMSAGEDAEAYEPVGYFLWRRALASVPLSRQSTAFVDLGAGLGRALLLAAEAGFGRVIGIELDPDLAASARRNVSAWATRRGAAGQNPIVRQEDAAHFRLPAGSVVVHMFNPFGPTTLQRVLENLCASRDAGQQVFVAYINPVHADVVARFPALVRHAGGKKWAVYRLEP